MRSENPTRLKAELSNPPLPASAATASRVSQQVTGLQPRQAASCRLERQSCCPRALGDCLPFS